MHDLEEGSVQETLGLVLKEHDDLVHVLGEKVLGSLRLSQAERFERTLNHHHDSRTGLSA